MRGDGGANDAHAGGALAAFTEQVSAWIRTAAPVNHLDETGYRIRGRTQWLHVLSTQLLMFYRTSAQRSAVGQGLVGCLVQDCWQSYFRVPGMVHALCNAHILRELQALVKIDREDWARRMQRLRRRAVRIAQRLGVPLPDSLLERIRKRYARLVQEGLAYHRGLEPLARGRRGGSSGGRVTIWRCGCGTAQRTHCAC